ncbi:hypothetical protein A33M_2866 [Rhodovulum sp. PH10]|nr:hypothetical protein A33M_2866 [Rhodovulum sp. PH10]
MFRGFAAGGFQRVPRGRRDDRNERDSISASPTESAILWLPCP